MNNLDAYRELERLGVKVAGIRFEKSVALADAEGYLLIDHSKIESQAQELEILLHEIGHFETASFYRQSTPYLERQKQEARAVRCVFEKYYPPAQLAALMANGHTEPWQIAEALGLPERFVGEMLQFYVEVRGISFNQLAARQTEPPHGQYITVGEYLDALRLRGIHLLLADDADVADIEKSLAIVEPYMQMQAD